MRNYHSPKKKHAQLNVTNLIFYEISPKSPNESYPIMDRKENLRNSKLPYDPTFWESNGVVQPVPAPEVMKQDIERSRSLEEQFMRNGNK